MAAGGRVSDMRIRRPPFRLHLRGGSVVNNATPSVWRVRDYRAWFVGDTLTQVGLSVGSFAFTLLGYHLTADAFLAGLIGTVSAAARAVAILPGGVLADMFDARRLMIWSGLGAFGIYGVLSGMYLTETLTTGSLLVIAACEGMVVGLFFNVTDVALPRIVGKELLADASAANQSRDAAIRLAAAPVSGFLFGLHPSVPLIVSAVTRLGEVGSALAIKKNLAPERRDDAPAVRSLSSGSRWLAAWRQPRVLIGLVVLVNFALGACGMTIVLSQQEAGTPAWQIGIIQTFQGAGVLAGGVVVGWALRRLSGQRIVQISICTITIAFSGLLFTQSVWVVAVLGFVASLPLIPLNAVQGSFLALIIPDQIRGRVLSLSSLLGSLAGALAPLLAGTLLEYSNYATAIGVPLAILASAAIAAVFSKAVASIPRRSEFGRIEALPVRPR
ncbi:MFS transporter [Microbacterium sp. LWH11-1.2]|uniref:MFS transporter n=1 Tax=Microbacterium sp. LWH11-1.2 TaxID=3135258 RepID=UPI0031396CFE